MVCNWNSQIDLVRDGMDITDISVWAGDSQGSLSWKSWASIHKLITYTS